MDSEGKIPFGVLVSKDLFFTSRVTSTASTLGTRVRVAGTVEQAAELLKDSRCVCLMLDLATPNALPADVMAETVASDELRTIAFGAHVHTALLERATAAGFDQVITKGRFTAELPAILRQVFGNQS